eukprot:46434-Hanusia_phi.AAC.1
MMGRFGLLLSSSNLGAAGPAEPPASELGLSRMRQPAVLGTAAPGVPVPGPPGSPQPRAASDSESLGAS